MKPWVVLGESEQEKLIDLSIDIDPVPQPRHRSARSRGYRGIITYQAPSGHPIYGFKSRVAHAVKMAMKQRPPVDLPISVELTFYFRPPKGMSEKRLVQQGGLMASGPDVDNLQKAVFDALSKVAMIDDRLIVHVSCTKRYTEKLRTQGTIHLIITLLGKEVIK